MWFSVLHLIFSFSILSYLCVARSDTLDITDVVVTTLTTTSTLDSAFTYTLSLRDLFSIVSSTNARMKRFVACITFISKSNFIMLIDFFFLQLLLLVMHFFQFFYYLYDLHC